MLEEELSEIAGASLYGAATEDKNEVSVKGIVTKELLEELLTDSPEDKEIYNKMTRYFTVNIKNDLYDIWSGHYGTEMYIEMASVKDIAFLSRSWISILRSLVLQCYNDITYLVREIFIRNKDNGNPIAHRLLDPRIFI